MALQRFLAAAAGDLRRPLAQLCDEAGHPLPAAGKQVALALGLRRQHRHRSGAYPLSLGEGSADTR